MTSSSEWFSGTPSVNRRSSRADAELLLAANKNVDAARNFWVSEEFDRISATGENQYQRAAEIADVLSRKSEAMDEQPLTHAVWLIDSSEKMRSSVSELLSLLTVGED